MTVNNAPVINQYNANGTITVFSYNFRIDSSQDLAVYIDDSILSSGFTVQTLGNSGGFVTFGTPPAADSKVTIIRKMSPVRTTDYQNGGDFRADTVDTDFDSVWLYLQQLNHSINNLSLLISETETPNGPLVLPSDRANKLLGFDENGLPVVTQTTITELDDLVQSALVALEAQLGNLTIGADDLDQELTDIIAQISDNSANLAQEIQNRNAALEQSAIDRQNAILNALNDAIDRDDDIISNIERIDTIGSNASISAENAGLAAQSAINSTVQLFAEVDTINSTANALAAQVSSISTAASTAQSAANAAQSTADAAAASASTAQTTANTAQSAANAAQGTANSNASNITLLQADVVQLQNDVATGVGGAASVQSVQDVDARVDALEGDIATNASDITTIGTLANSAQSAANAAQSTANTAQTQASNAATSASAANTAATTAQTTANNAATSASAAQSTANTAIARINNVNGAGKTIETLSSNVDAVTSSANTANTNANSAVTSASLALTRLNNLGTGLSAEAVALKVDTIDVSVNGISANVTTQAAAISDLENGVGSLWEVKATAGDVTGSVGLYNNGANTRFLIVADDAQIDRGNGPESLFDTSGAIIKSFVGVQSQNRTSSVTITSTLGSFNTTVSGASLTSLQGGTLLFDFRTSPGVYEVQFFCNFTNTSNATAEDVLTLNIRRVRLSGETVNNSPYTTSGIISAGTRSSVDVSGTGGYPNNNFSAFDAVNSIKTIAKFNMGLGQLSYGLGGSLVLDNTATTQASTFAIAGTYNTDGGATTPASVDMSTASFIRVSKID